MLPGVGAFGACMQALRDSGLEAVTRAAATDGRPFLGICIGMQMLFDGSDETPDVAGLGVIAGRVTLLPKTVRLPQMGWNTLEITPGSRLGTGLPDPAWLYFVHSYAPEPADAECGRGVVRLRPPVRGRDRSRTGVGHAVPPREVGRSRDADARRTSSTRYRAGIGS